MLLNNLEFKSILNYLETKIELIIEFIINELYMDINKLFKNCIYKKQIYSIFLKYKNSYNVLRSYSSKDNKFENIELSAVYTRLFDNNINIYKIIKKLYKMLNYNYNIEEYNKMNRINYICLGTKNNEFYFTYYFC